MERWSALFPEPPFAPGALREAFLDGGHERAFGFLARLPADVPASALDPAPWSLRLDRTDEALDWLERGIRNTSPTASPRRS